MTARRARDARDWPEGQQPIDTGTAELVRTSDDPTAATLYINGMPSSHIDLADPDRLEFEYMQHMAALLDLLPEGPLRVAHLGGGGCTMPRYLDHTRPGSRQLVVELDGRLATLVRDWFDLPRSPALRIRVGEARAELARLAPGKADVVVRDVFAGHTTPEHLRTVEAVTEARRALRPGGVLLLNSADYPPLARVRAEVATLRQVFRWVGLIAEPPLLRGRRFGNVVLAAADGAPVDEALLTRRLRTLPAPAAFLTGQALVDLAAGARPITDAALAPDDRPPVPTGAAETAPERRPDDEWSGTRDAPSGEPGP